MKTGTWRSARGFTLIELLVVLTLITTLSAIGMAQYSRSITYAREATLKEDLFRMRDAIDQYLRGQESVSRDDRRAGERGLPAQDSRRSVHEERVQLADSSSGTRPEQSLRRSRHLRHQERVRSDRPRRPPVFRVLAPRFAFGNLHRPAASPNHSAELTVCVSRARAW